MVLLRSRNKAADRPTHSSSDTLRGGKEKQSGLVYTSVDKGTGMVHAMSCTYLASGHDGGVVGDDDDGGGTRTSSWRTVLPCSRVW